MPLHGLLLIDSHRGFRESARKFLLRCPDFSSVEIEGDYKEGMLFSKQYDFDLLLVDSVIYFGTPELLNEIEKLKKVKPSLGVLLLFLFREEGLNCGQDFQPLVSGIILKESFAEDLYEYLAAERKGHAKSRGSLHKGVDSFT